MTDRPQNTDSLGVEDQIVAATRRIIRAVDLHSRRLVESCGLTGPQLAVLREVGRREEVSPTALARAVHLSGATVTGIVTRLQRRGLVQRGRDTMDRRVVLVTLTPAGHEVLRGVPSQLQDRFRRELTVLEDWEQTLMLGTLQRIAAMMDADELDAAPHLEVTPSLTAPVVTEPEVLPESFDGAEPPAVAPLSTGLLGPAGVEETGPAGQDHSVSDVPSKRADATDSLDGATSSDAERRR